MTRLTEPFASPCPQAVTHSPATATATNAKGFQLFTRHTVSVAMRLETSGFSVSRLRISVSCYILDTRREAYRGFLAFNVPHPHREYACDRKRYVLYACDNR
jgi:hypothetical protein